MMAGEPAVKAITSILRKDAGMDDVPRLVQLAWMVFLKALDDRETEKEILDDRYRSPIPEQLRWRSWAAPASGLTGPGRAVRRRARR